MITLVNLWIEFFSFFPAWFSVFLLGCIGLLAILFLFWVLKLIWDSIPFL